MHKLAKKNLRKILLVDDSFLQLKYRCKLVVRLKVIKHYKELLFY